jgi:predicted nuclease with TOPRIM domain
VLEPVIKKKIGANLQSSEANIATIEQLLKLRASFDENRERVNSEMEKFHELIASQSQKNNELNELNTLLIQRLEVSEKANKEMEKRLNHFSFEISKLNRRFVQLIICFCIGFSIALLVAIFI